MTAPPIRLVDAGKRYTKYQDAPMIITAALRFRRRTRRSHLWAVRHVDFDVTAGECVGVIGRNGAGKSTMLQLLAGVTAPTEGLVAVRGRVAPLISVGVGFHPELTGRENVYVNGTILGMERKEIDRKLDSIIAFSEIPEFIDTPVKFYSSGMFVRLGFAVAIHAEPEVLLVDEVLAVGDFAFQIKCFERMMEQREAGTTIAVVSHNLNAVRRLCDRTIVLHKGEKRFDGATLDGISLFHELAEEERDLETDDGVSAGPSAIEAFTLRRASGGEQTARIDTGEEVVFRTEARFAEDVEDPIFGFRLTNDRGLVLYSESSMTRPVGLCRAGQRLFYDVRLELPLLTGSYTAEAAIHAPDGKTWLARPRSLPFFVVGRKMVNGVADLRASFELAPAPEEPAVDAWAQPGDGS